MTHKLSAVLFSGRPQTAKARPGLLDFGGQKVVERTLAAYADFAQVVLVVDGDPTGFPAKDARIEVVTLPEGAPVAEQLRAGVAAAGGGSKGFSLGLIDQPLLTKELVDAMAEKFLGGKAQILAPVALRQIGQPVFFRSELAGEFASLGADETAWTILKRHGDAVDVFETHHTSVIRNIEDTDDYHALLALAGLPVPQPVEGETADA